MDHRFQIHLRGIIDLLSQHLYSGPQVYVRELLQNGIDAVTARAQLAPSPERSSWGIRIEVRLGGDSAPTLLLDDDGVGLTESEVHAFLATIGESAKRGDELAAARGDLLGQFGIGLLSGFLVSDEIVVVTRSARSADAPTLEWRGRPDGTYTIRTLERARDRPGTSVTLAARPGLEEWLAEDKVEELVRHFGSLLPLRVELTDSRGTRTVNEGVAPWRRQYASERARHDAMIAYGRDALGIDALTFIPLRSDVGEVDGVAFVLPFSPTVASKRADRVYLKGMLLSDRADDLAPSWAFFVRCVLDARALRPTASREAFYVDASLEAARDAIGDRLRAWLVDLAKHAPDRLHALIALHHLSIRALAVEDDEFYGLFAPWLPFETSMGWMPLGEIAKRSPTIHYTASADEFRQIAPIAMAQGLVVLNACHTYDAELLERASVLLTDVRVAKIDAARVAAELEPLEGAEADAARPFREAAERAIGAFGVRVDVRRFRPAELPTFYGRSDEAELARSIARTRESVSELWSSVLGDLAPRPSEDTRPSITFNWRCPLVLKLASVDDAEILDLSLRMLYVQALLLGHHPLAARERELLGSSLTGLIGLALDARGGGLQ